MFIIPFGYTLCNNCNFYQSYLIWGFISTVPGHFPYDKIYMFGIAGITLNHISTGSHGSGSTVLNQNASGQCQKV